MGKKTIDLKKIIFQFKIRGYRKLLKLNKLNLIEKLKLNFEKDFITEDFYIPENLKKFKRSIIITSSINKIFGLNFNKLILYSYGIVNNNRILLAAPNSIKKFIVNQKLFF